MSQIKLYDFNIKQTNIEIKIIHPIHSKMGNCCITQDELYRAPHFTLGDQKLHGKVTRCIDGDTIECSLKFHNKFYIFTIRLEGIDTPELHSRDEQEKNLAIFNSKAVGEPPLMYGITVGVENRLSSSTSWFFALAAAMAIASGVFGR